MAPPSNDELARLSDAELMEEAAATPGPWPLWRDASSLVTAELDRREAWRAEGATSLESWIMERCGVSLPTARAYAAVGERLFDLPHLAAALCGGTLSFDKVRAVAESASPERDAEWAEAAKRPRCASWSSSPARTGGPPRPRPTPRTTPGRCASTSTLRTISAQLPEESYAKVRACLEAKARAFPPTERPGRDQRLADAFVAIVSAGARGAGKARPT